jgi:hypothetical protein
VSAPRYRYPCGPKEAPNEETHALEVIKGDLVAEKVKEDVLESASVSVGEDEAIAVGPLRVGGVALEELGYESEAEVRVSQARSCDCRGVATSLQKRTWAAGAIPMGAPAVVHRN